VTTKASGVSGLAARAVVALLLLVGFYAMALSIAAALIYVVYAMVVLGHRVYIKLVFLMVAGAGAILWGILPRPDRFESPGPLLTEALQPRLFAMIRSVAKATGQAMPAEVFLVSDLNAFVAQRGGIMGFGSRRVMGLGLPLLQILNVSQLKGVLAHEFGHFHGGDVKLGPWIYKTRGAIERTIRTLIQTGSSIIYKPFHWYGMMFLRVTHAISRNQELQADALAARVVGVTSMIEGLKIIHGSSLAFNSYMNDEFAPLIGAGYLPPLADGFRRFVGVKHLTDIIDASVEEALSDTTSDPYDTHPPLSERVAALRSESSTDPACETAPAIDFISDLPALENQLMHFVLARPERIAELKRIDWSVAGKEAYPVVYKKMEDDVLPFVKGITAESLPPTVNDMASWGEKKLSHDAIGADQSRLALFTARTFGVAVILKLLQQGWEIQTFPGEPVVLVRGAVQVEPVKVAIEIAQGKLPFEKWRDLCETAGLLGVDLG
jgi:heat shock protein HtpX